MQLPTLLRERQFTRRFSANRRMLLLIIYTHGATATPCSCICPCSPDFPSAPCRHHRPRPCRTMGCIYEHVHIRVASRSSTPADTSAQPPSCALVVCLPSPHSVFGQVHEPRSTVRNWRLVPKMVAREMKHKLSRLAAQPNVIEDSHPSLLLTMPRLHRRSLRLIWLPLLLRESAHAFAPLPPALRPGPVPPAVSPRGISALPSATEEKVALPRLQPTTVAADQKSWLVALPETSKQRKEVPSQALRLGRLVATFGAVLALFVATPALAKGGGGASGGGGGGSRSYSRSYSRSSSRPSSRSSEDEEGSVLVALVLYGGKVVFDAACGIKKPQAPSSSKRSQLELERRSRVASAHPLSIHAAQRRTVKGLSATYSAEYTERGCSGKSTYDLLFADGRVTGKGWDADGDFQVRGLASAQSSVNDLAPSLVP